MCNLYSMTSGPAAITAISRAMVGDAGNLPPLPSIYPDQLAPIVRAENGDRVLAMARWGMPSPRMYVRNYDRGVTNVRNTRSPHWRRWLDPQSRCVVPFTVFSEPHPETKRPVWFALHQDVAFFAGIWVPSWKSVRKVKDGETVDDLFAFLTCEANEDVASIHPKAMPVILTSAAEVDQWMTAPTPEALELQRPLPAGMLRVLAGEQTPTIK